ncbi:MAG: ATP-grasp domain-containing protein [Gammaproteobacteria bacterium]|nr:ATP-grasp domain-containing protein [Gammaproteobacteria bacterium]
MPDSVRPTQKTLLILSGGAEAVPGIRRAKAMGLHVVVSDYDADCPGFRDADDTLLVSTYDIDRSVAVANEYHNKVRRIDGVICMAADVPLTVAHIANTLGLPGLSLATAALAVDKLAMKRHLFAAGIPVPWYSAIESVDQLAHVVAQHDKLLILKPVDSRGARGVLRLQDGINLPWAFQHAQACSPTGRVMVEHYVEGPQVSTETIIVDNKAITLGFIDRNYEYLERFTPYVIENGGQQGTSLSAVDQRSMIRLAERAAEVMGINNGIAKGDLVLTAQGPMVIEIAARLSGGWMSSDQIPLATGVNIIDAAIRLALGDAVDLQALTPHHQQGVAIRYFFPSPGRVKAIQNVEKLGVPAWVHRLDFFLKTGDVVAPVSDHTCRAGFVITTGKDREEAVARANQVVTLVSIETIVA